MTTTKALVNTIVDGIKEKKGENIVVADLSQLDGAITKYFVICQGNSPTQVEAIAQSVGFKAKTEASEDPINVAGLGSDQWVAIDYADVMVHIFQPEARHFYDLEHLWEDAKITVLPND
ncbi:MAG: ribosome silencing factor [Prevotellaceae bacterium]|nr:ribosome silencing factor [Prevotellaceae bacterium]